MRTIPPESLPNEGIRFLEPAVFAESWSKRKSFALYKHVPRPASAFFFVCTDLTMTFFEQGGRTVTARKGDAVYLPEGALYRAEVSGNATDEIDTYTVNCRLFDDSGESVRLSDGITLLAHVEDNGLSLRVAALERAVRQTDGSEGRNLLRINAAFYSLLDAVVTATSTESGAYYPIRVGAEALRAEWNRNERIEKYAELCGISNAYFYRSFRAWSGKSPVEYRNHLRLSNAETMLRYTDMRVSEISERVGFDDPFYFCRIFTRRFGVSPQNYRSSFRASEE